LLGFSPGTNESINLYVEKPLLTRRLNLDALSALQDDVTHCRLP
jgi:hypothetical protein